MSDHKNEIRCICGRRPLLAVYGRDSKGELFIHLRVYKSNRTYAEMWVSAAAKVRIRCRECLRIQKISIISDRPVLREEREAMDAMSVQPATSQVAPRPDPTVR